MANLMQSTIKYMTITAKVVFLIFFVGKFFFDVFSSDDVLLILLLVVALEIIYRNMSHKTRVRND